MNASRSRYSLRPFFCFYGGKWRAVPRYPAPEHRVIVEPFAGAAGYSTRYPDRQVILVEKDPTIAALWRYLVKVSPEELRALPDIAHDRSVDDFPELAPEARSLIGFWLNKGNAQPCKRPSMWMRNADEPWMSGKYARSGSYWGPRIRETLAAQVEAIRHWTVIEGDYHSVDAPRATWFVDPPYQGAGKHYRCSSRDIDYDELGRWCRSRRGQVIVCENEGATWLPFRTFASIKSNPSKRGKGRSAEAIWTNSSPELAASAEE